MRIQVGRKLGLFGGAAAATLLIATGALAAPDAASEADRDARIARLEAAVAALQSAAQDNAALRAQNQELQGEVSDLQAQVADLKSTSNQQTDDIRHTIAAQPTVSLADGRPTFSTADGNFTASLRGVLQFDTAFYSQNSPGVATGGGATDFRRDGPALGSSSSNVDLAHARELKDGTLFRRARIGVDGSVLKTFDYRLLFDFGGSGTENTGQVYEAWLQYSGLQPLKLRVGAFAPAMGLEDQGSTNGMPFLERPGSSDVARGIAGGDTRTAIALFGNGARWFFSAALTGRTISAINSGAVLAINSTPSTAALGTAQTFGDQLGFVGRVNYLPIRTPTDILLVGAHGANVLHTANNAGPATNGVTPLSTYVVRLRDTPELRVDGTQFVDTGNIPARHASTWGLEFAAQHKNLFLQAEYESFNVQRTDTIASPNFSAWYVEGTWLITGEQRKYNAGAAAFDAPPVAHPVKLTGGGWGAWELALRYSDLDLNYNQGALGTAPSSSAIRGGRQQIFAAGINWYFNPVMRVMLNVERVHIDRLSPNATNYQTPAGAQIGQDFTAVAIRTQAAF